MIRRIVIACFGNREKQVQRLVLNIRSYVDYPIHILTTKDSNIGSIQQFENITIELVERIWPKGTLREGVRNSNYHKIDFAIRHPYDSLILLDDDMFIVNEHFTGGFSMAENFGAALPINPRTFVCYNSMGADVRQRDLEIMYDDLGMPSTLPAVNFSPFFVYPPWQGGTVMRFLLNLENELRTVPCRGTIAVNKAMWKTNYTPVILPEQWCVCCENSEYLKNYSVQLKGKQIQIPNIMLHLGHDKVQEVFKDIINEK